MIVISGEIIIGLELLDGGDWCNGYVFNVNNVKEKLTGIFPTDQCWRLDPLAYLKQDDITSSSKTKILKFAQVIHGMTAQLDEEIDLVEGQQVVITEFIDKDWYRYGMFRFYLSDLVLIRAIHFSSVN